MKIYEFRMRDKYNWTKEAILEEAMIAARRRMEIEFAGDTYTIDSVHIGNITIEDNDTTYEIVVLGRIEDNTVTLYEFTMTDSFNLSMLEIQSRAEEAAKQEEEFVFNCSQGTEEWNIDRVELEGLPVSKDDSIVYKFVVYGTVRE